MIARSHLPALTRLALALFGLVALLAAPAGPAAAQEDADDAGIDVEIRLEPDPVRIGDHVTVFVIAEHDSDVIVTPRPPRGANVDLVQERLPETDSLGGDREQTVTEFVVQPFALGTLELDPLRVEWLRDDSTAGTLELNGVVIEVAPLRAADDDALRALRGQLEVPGAPAAWVRPVTIAAAVLASLLILGGGLLWLWSRRGEEEIAAPDVTAEEQARATLNTLVGLRLQTDADFELYYGLISITVRGYLQQRFGFSATALTTTELEERMVSRGVDRWQARLVGGLLQRADAAVYARQYPDPASADHDLTMAFEIVELSRPRVEEPEEEEAVGV